MTGSYEQTNDNGTVFLFFSYDLDSQTWSVIEPSGDSHVSITSGVTLYCDASEERLAFEINFKANQIFCFDEIKLTKTKILFSQEADCYGDKVKQI